jgi:hypothetical protein
VLEQYPEMHRDARRAVVELLAKGAIAPMVGAAFPFDRRSMPARSSPPAEFRARQ